MPSCKTIKIPTPDKDFLELDVIIGHKNNPAIMLVHGLEGSSKSRYIIELIAALYKQHYSVVAVNLRGCGSRLNKKRRFYHSGETGDLKTILTWVDAHIQHSFSGAVGFSLGGNMLLKLLGEQESSAQIDGAVAVSAPYDLFYGSQTIQKGLNVLYERMFVHSMKKKLKKKRKTFSDMPVFKGTTLHDFDDEITAPMNGFKNADDYYARCSSGQFVGNIKTRSLLIHSKDDPICPYEMIPMKGIKQNDFIDYIVTERGGHVGFWSQPYGWLNRTIVNYFSRIFD